MKTFTCQSTLFLSALVICLSRLTAGADAPPTSDAATPTENLSLLGYGKVTASFPPHAAIFECEDQAHADIMLSKLQADLAWDVSLSPKSITLSNGASGLTLDGYGVLVAARKGSAFYVVTGESPDAVVKRMAELSLSGPDVAYQPAKRHPASLDFFDLNAIRFNKSLLHAKNWVKGDDPWSRSILESRYTFWNNLDIGVGTNLRGGLGSLNRLDGAPDDFYFTYEMGLAREAKQPMTLFFGPAAEPWWMRNQFPDEYDQSEGVWGWQGSTFAGAAYPSTGMSDAMFSYINRFDLDIVAAARQNAGDLLAGIDIQTGHPGDEVAFHGLSTELMDFSPANIRAFRDWLQTTRKLDLAGLNQRWYGDASPLKSWDDVMPPSLFEFFGGFGKGTLDLSQEWLWRPDSDQAKQESWWNPAYQPGNEWVHLDLAPSQDQMLLFAQKDAAGKQNDPSRGFWFRKQFDAADWLQQNQGKDTYLVADTYQQRKFPVNVYLNGNLLGAIAPPGTGGPISVKITGMIQPTNNVLTLHVQGDNLIHGPVFLTTEEPTSYPYLGRQENARWIDLRDWLIDRMMNRYKKIAAPVIAALPDHPVMFVPGSFWPVADHCLDLKTTSGISAIYDSGSNADYRPHWPEYGYVIGVYGGSEEAGTEPNPLRLTEEMGWFLYNGLGFHNYVDGSEAYMPVENQTHWFSQNKRLLQLLGKALWHKPSVALLLSPKTDLYFPSANIGGSWDIGHLSLQAAHYTNVYVTPAEIEAGLVNDYPVLFDCSTPVMDDDLLHAIENYVRNGGTFIALNGSGRNSLLEPDTWPISQLTGYSVIGDHDQGSVQILDTPYLKNFAGRTLPGQGTAINWMGMNLADKGSIALKPQLSGKISVSLKQEADQTETLAQWEDGSVAIGLRHLGKGRVVTIGSTFWRSVVDPGGQSPPVNGSLQTKFLDDLLSGLGVAKEADSSSPDVWVDRQFTKNGLQEWLVAFNDSKTTSSNVTLSASASAAPEQVVDVITGEKPAFTYEDGMIHFSPVDFAPHETKVFGWKAGEFDDAVKTWFAEKKKYWQQYPPHEEVAPSSLPPASAIIFDQFRFRMLNADEAAGQGWLTEATDAGAWKDMGYGFWNDSGFPSDGTAAYRCKFTAPANWNDHRIVMTFASFDAPVFEEDATVFINGTQACEYKAHGGDNFDTYDVTSLVKEGENNLGILLKADQRRGGYMGQLGVYALRSLSESIPLNNWDLYTDNFNHTSVQLPLKGKGVFVQTSVDLPKTWKGKQVYLEFDSADIGMDLVYINGKLVTLNNLHSTVGLFQVNLTPYVHPGETNKLSIWARAGTPYISGTTLAPANCQFTLNTATLGIAKPGPAP